MAATELKTAWDNGLCEAKCNWISQDCLERAGLCTNMELKSYQQQLSERYQQQDKEMGMIEKGLERLTATRKQLGARRGSWLIFQ